MPTGKAVRTPELSIIIVTHNSLRDLIVCLDSIRRNVSGLSCEIIIVDNFSVDRSDVSRALSDQPDIRFISLGHNLGFAAANNIGFRCANGRAVLMLNPDTTVTPGSIEKLYRRIMDDDTIGIVGPLIVDDKGRIDPYCARRFPTLSSEFFAHLGLSTRFPGSRVFNRYLMAGWDRRTERDVELLSGACLMMRRDKLDRVGPMDERFFIYGDDVELCFRFRKAGYRIHFDPAATIVHKGGTSIGHGNCLSYLISLESMNKFFRYHRGVAYAMLHRILILLIHGLKGMFFWAGKDNRFSRYYPPVLWSLGALKFRVSATGMPYWLGISWRK